MFIDISRKLNKDIYVYEGDPTFESYPVYSVEHGDECNVSKISFGTHTGTHIDAPRHFIKNGKNISDFPIEAFCGKARVIDIKNSLITKEDISCNNIAEDILLFKTQNGAFDGIKPLLDCVYLSIDAAKYIVDKKIRLVGIDYISVDSPTSPSYPVHKILLENNVLILENICLNDVCAGVYRLYCFPLFIDGGDAAPLRAVLETL